MRAELALALSSRVIRDVRGINMRADKIKTFDDLESAIEDSDVGCEELILAYRKLVLEMLQAGAFDRISGPNLERTKSYLDEMPKALLIQNVDAKSKARSELWRWADANKENFDLYNLTRALVFMYGKTEEWAIAQDSIISYFYMCLQRVVADCEARFVDHFANELVAN
jgi:hypothetical protein